METLSLRTKKQIVLSQIIYNYIINGLADSLSTISEQDTQLLVMRLNIQAITHAIDMQWYIKNAVVSGARKLRLGAVYCHTYIKFLL